MYDYDMPDCEPINDKPVEHVDPSMDFASEDEWLEFASQMRQCPVDEAEEFGIPRRRLRYAYQV